MNYSFQLSAGSLWQRIVFGGCMAAFAVLGSIRFMQGASEAVFIPLVVLIPLGIFAFRGIWINDDVLRIGPDGIWCQAWPRKDPLPWNQVQGIKLLTIGPGDPFICFFTSGESDHDLPMHAVRVSDLNVRTKAAYEISMNCWQQFGKNHQA